MPAHLLQIPNSPRNCRPFCLCTRGTSVFPPAVRNIRCILNTTRSCVASSQLVIQADFTIDTSNNSLCELSLFEGGQDPFVQQQHLISPSQLIFQCHVVRLQLCGISYGLCTLRITVLIRPIIMLAEDLASLFLDKKVNSQPQGKIPIAYQQLLNSSPFV
jgi:hypothetical protein